MCVCVCVCVCVCAGRGRGCGAGQGERASTDGNNLLGKFVIEGVERAKAVRS